MSEFIMAALPYWLGFMALLATPKVLVAIFEMYHNAYHNLKRRLKK